MRAASRSGRARSDHLIRMQVQPVNRHTSSSRSFSRIKKVGYPGIACRGGDLTT